VTLTPLPPSAAMACHDTVLALLFTKYGIESGRPLPETLASAESCDNTSGNVLSLIVTLWLMVLYIRKCVVFNRDIVVDGTIYQETCCV
jgi:hypothetical protein